MVNYWTNCKVKTKTFSAEVSWWYHPFCLLPDTFTNNHKIKYFSDTKHYMRMRISPKNSEICTAFNVSHQNTLFKQQQNVWRNYKNLENSKQTFGLKTENYWLECNDLWSLRSLVKNPILAKHFFSCSNLYWKSKIYILGDSKLLSEIWNATKWLLELSFCMGLVLA